MQSLFLNSEGRLRNAWKILSFFVAYMVLQVVFDMPVVVIGVALKADLRSLLELKFGPLMGALAGLAATALFLAIDRKPFHSVGFKLNRRWVWEIGLGTLGGLLLMSLIAIVLFGLGGFHWTRNPGSHLLGIAGGFLVFLFVAINEEVAFRGYPFQRLVESLGQWPAQAIFAFLFVAIHLGNPGIRGAGMVLKSCTALNIGLAAILLGF